MFKIAEKDHCSSNPGWNPDADPSSNPGSDPSSNPGSKFRYPRKFHVVVWQTTSKHRTKKRAARAAQLSFFIQPIKSLICGGVVDVAVVKS